MDAKIIALDVHSGTSQMHVMTESGQVLLEMPVATEKNALRGILQGIPGPKGGGDGARTACRLCSGCHQEYR